MEEKSKLFYDDLVGSGYKLPDYETFKTSLQDQSKADAFYKDLSSSGFKLPDFDTFYGVFKSQEPEVQQPVVEQPVERIPTSGIKDFVANINQTVMNIPADIADTWSIASAFTERQLAKLGVPGADPNIGAKDVGIGIPYSKITDEYRNIVSELAPVSDEFKGTFAGGVSQGLGQVAGMLLTGGGSRATEIAKMTKSVNGSLTPIVNAGKDLLKNMGSRQGLIGGSMNASANYQQAINDGATEEEALRYGIENMIVGSVMENLPIQSMFSRISKMEPGAKILDVVKNGLVGAGEEAVTEGFQTTYENLSAERIYDLQKNMLDGVGDAAAVGGTVGFILNSAMSALIGKKAKMNSQNEPNEDVESFINEIPDEEIRTFRVTSIDQIPEEFRDRAKKSKTTGKTDVYKTFLGIPYQKETSDVFEIYSYDATGKEIKDAYKKSKNQDVKLIDKAIEETQEKINTIEENNKKVEETVSALENTRERVLNNGATDLEFIENPDGSIELAEDGLTAPDAESKKLLLEAKYPNVEFQVIDNTNKDDPYAESDFTIVGQPKTKSRYSKGQEVLSKNQADFLIQGATTLDELEGLNIENDPELEQSLQSKFEELNVGQPEVIAEQPAIEEPGAEGQVAPEIVPEEPVDQGIDIEVPVAEPTTPEPEIIAEKPIKDGKTKQKTTPSKSVKEKSAGGPKKRSGKGRVPLDERQLKGKEAQAAKLTPNTIEESVLSWFVNKGRLSYGGLQSIFGQQKQGFKKNIQGEFNARRAYIRTPDKGGKNIEEIVNEIYNNLPESLTEKASADPTAIKSAIENAIIENSSIAQMAEKLLSGRGVDTKVSRQLPPIEERSAFPDDAIRQTFTPEEQASLTPQDKADFFNEYFQYPKGSEYEYTAEMIEALEGENVDQDEFESDIDFLSAMSDEELVEFEKNYKGVEAEFAPETTIIPEKGDRVSFIVFGESMTGTKKGGNFIGDDGTIYKPSMVKDVAPIVNESQIDISKKKIKALKTSLKTQITEDKQGIIVDFEAKAKDDIKFFNTLRNLVIEYARLKGLQFNEFVADVQKLLGQEIDKKNREYLKSVWDAEKKAAPRKNVMAENKSMPYKDQVKQGIAELVASKNRELKIKLERERAKADERVKEAKDKGKEALAQFENIKNTMVEFIKMDLKDIPVDSFTKGELNKILTQINRARTDWSLNLAIGKAYDILGEAGKKKRISVAKEKVSQAKKNIKAGKIGVLQPNSPLDQMLRINPKIIPQRIFDEYESILGEVGARKTVLSPSERSVLFRRVSEVMKEVDKDNSLLNSLKYEYDNFEDKGETYSETLTRMLKEDIISEEEMEFMKLRKSEIQEKQEAEKTEPSQEELDEAIDSILNEIPNLPQPGNNFSKDENKIIRFFNSLNEADLQGLTLKDLSSIYSLMGNLENNYVPHLAEKLRQRIEGTRNAKVIQPITKGFKGKWSDILSRTKAGIKNKFMQDETTSMRERIRMNPLAYIDQSLRNFKNTLFYDSTFRKLASSYSAFDSDFKTVLEKLLKAESGLKNQFESRAKMMMMAIQGEFESNPGAKVHSAKDWLDATIADKYSIYTADSKRKLKELFDSLSTNGEFDLKKAEKSLSKEERAARKAIEEINNYLTPIADWTATVIRGNRVPIHENYIHLPRKVKGGQPANFDPKTMGGPLNPSTKSGALIERTGKTHAISFDVFDNVLSGAKQTLMDYHLTPTVREMNQTFSQLESLAESDSEVEAAIQISKIYEESLKNTVGVSMAEENLPDAIFNEVARKGYQAILSGVGKSISEFTSNSIFAGMFKLDATTNGIKILSNLKPDKSSAVVKNVGSTHSSRLYNTSGMDSKHTEFAGYNTKKLAKVSGVDESVVSRMVNVARDNKWYRTVDNIQSTLMSSPDQVVARPLWMGVFNQAFIRETNQDPDFDKIAANDQEYMDQYSEAIDIARNEADDTVTEAVASANPFDGILKNTQAPGGSAIGKYVNTFNSFMTRFAVYEYNSAVRGVNALIGNGKMSKADGAKLLGALTVRLMFYDLMTETLLGLIYQSIAGLFSDQKEEEKEDLGDILSRSFVSSMIMLTLNRNMGNVAKTPINYAVELANKEFGEGVTYTGEYDPFTSSVVYPLIPVEIEPGSKGIPQMLVENTSASMMPLTKTAFRTMTVAHRALTSKTDEAKERNMKELVTRTPIEIAGNLGYIPFYKDVRKVLLNYWYNAEEQIDKEVGEDKESKRKFGER